jgi:hypothetical protein
MHEEIKESVSNGSEQGEQGKRVEWVGTIYLNMASTLKLSLKSGDSGARTASFGLIGHQMCNCE